MPKKQKVSKPKTSKRSKPKFEAGRKYLTRDKKTARIYTVDGGGHYPIHGAVFDPANNVWIPLSWVASGSYFGIGSHYYDLTTKSAKELKP